MNTLQTSANTEKQTTLANHNSNHTEYDSLTSSPMPSSHLSFKKQETSEDQYTLGKTEKPDYMNTPNLRHRAVSEQEYKYRQSRQFDHEKRIRSDYQVFNKSEGSDQYPGQHLINSFHQSQRTRNWNTHLTSHTKFSENLASLHENSSQR